jgi:hypothetical protein
MVFVKEDATARMIADYKTSYYSIWAIDLMNESHKGKCERGPQILYVLPAKLTRNSLVYFTGIAILNKDMVHSRPSSNLWCGRKETHGRMENQQLVYPSRQCSSTPAGFGQRFLSKEQRDNTGASFILYWPGYSCSLYCRYSMYHFCQYSCVLTD